MNFMKIGKLPEFLVPVIILISTLPGFADFQYKSDRVRAGLFEKVKKVTQTFDQDDNPSTIDLSNSEITSEYDCQGNLLKHRKSSGGLSGFYIYEILGSQKKLKYLGSSGIGRRADLLSLRSVRDQENYERFLIRYNSYNLYDETPKWNGLVLIEEAFIGLEIIKDLNPPAERAWRHTYFFNDKFRLTEIRSINGMSLIPTRKIYTYENNGLHPAAMTEEQDYRVVRKMTHRYILDNQQNWVKRYSAETDFGLKEPRTSSFVNIRLIVYFDDGECKD